MSEASTETIPTEPDAKSANISKEEATEVLQRAVGDLRQGWIQGAVRVASIVNAGQTVGRGTFDDLRNLRENWEELERARVYLRAPRSAGGTNKSQVPADQKKAEKEKAA